MASEDEQSHVCGTPRTLGFSEEWNVIMIRKQTETVQNGPLYRPQYQAFGQTPSILPDVPVNGAFLALFMFAAIVHITLYRNNKSNGRKFLISVMVGG